MALMTLTKIVRALKDREQFGEGENSFSPVQRYVPSLYLSKKPQTRVEGSSTNRICLYDVVDNETGDVRIGQA